MYYLFREKDVMPGEYYRMSPGEKVVLRAFFEKDIGLIKQEAKRANLRGKLGR